jgi:hypothetical protein
MFTAGMFEQLAERLKASQRLRCWRLGTPFLPVMITKNDGGIIL